MEGLNITKTNNYFNVRKKISIRKLIGESFKGYNNNFRRFIFIIFILVLFSYLSIWYIVGNDILYCRHNTLCSIFDVVIFPLILAPFVSGLYCITSQHSHKEIYGLPNLYQYYTFKDVPRLFLVYLPTIISSTILIAVTHTLIYHGNIFAIDFIYFIVAFFFYVWGHFTSRFLILHIVNKKKFYNISIIDCMWNTLLIIDKLFIITCIIYLFYLLSFASLGLFFFWILPWRQVLDIKMYSLLFNNNL